MSNLRILPRKLTALACILFISALIQCSSLLQVEKLKNCEFRLERIEGMSIDGININRVHSINDLGIINAAKILKNLSKGSLSSEFTIIISVNNPNKSAAAMEKFEYSVMLDENEVITGSLNDRMEILANKSIEFPLSATVNISKLLKQNSFAELMELANSLSNKNAIEKRVRIKVKPYIRIGKKTLKYPGFIEIKINEWSK
jgi:hypothetical protein